MPLYQQYGVGAPVSQGKYFTCVKGHTALRYLDDGRHKQDVSEIAFQSYDLQGRANPGD